MSSTSNDAREQIYETIAKEQSNPMHVRPVRNCRSTDVRAIRHIDPL